VTVATIGRDRVTTATLRERIQDAPPAYQSYLTTPAGKKQFLDLMVRERVVLEAARQAGFDKTKEYRKAVADFKKEQAKRLRDFEENMLMEQYMRDLQDKRIGTTDKEVDEYYEAHKQEFLHPVEVVARHILLDTEKEAEKTMERLKAGEDFSKLAQELSRDPISGARGGEIGPFRKGDLVPEFEQAVFPLKFNQLSGIVKTQFGYHIIKKVSEKVLPAMSPDAAKLEIRKITQKTKFDNWLEETKKKFAVKTNYEALVKVQLAPAGLEMPRPENIVKPQPPDIKKEPVNVKKK
jgi:hypothetical protein